MPVGLRAGRLRDLAIDRPDNSAGHIAVGWLVVEDLFTVLVLVLLPVVFRADETGAGGIVLALGWSVLKIGLLVVFTVPVGGRLLPWVLDRVAATRSRELFTLTVLVLALGIAVGAAKVFGVSMALGAFLAGMIVGRSDFGSRAASEALSMRDAFAVLEDSSLVDVEVVLPVRVRRLVKDLDARPAIWWIAD